MRSRHAIPGLIQRFGGHAMAAGLSIRRMHLARFTDAFATEIGRWVSARRDRRRRAQRRRTCRRANSNCRWPTRSRAADRGVRDFPEPLFHGDFDVVHQRVVGERHLKLSLRKDARVVDAIAFNQAAARATTQRAQVAYRLARNDYRDRATLQLVVEHIARRVIVIGLPRLFSRLRREHGRTDIAAGTAEGSAERATTRSGGIFDFADRKNRLEEIELELQQSDVWDDPDRAQALGKERAALERIVTNLERVGTGLGDMGELLEMAAAEDDAATLDDVERELDARRTRSSAISNSAACSTANSIRTTHSSKFRRVPAEPKRRIGPRCCCACI